MSFKVSFESYFSCVSFQLSLGLKAKMSKKTIHAGQKTDASLVSQTISGTPVTQAIAVQGEPSEGSHTVDVTSGAVLEGAVVGEDGTIQLSMEECLQQGITVNGPDRQETMLIIKTQPVDSNFTD